MLSKDIVKEIKQVKGQAKFFTTLNSLYPNPNGYYKPSDFKTAVTEAIIATVPHLAPILAVSPITNGTANAIASRLDK